jgi:GTPase SAR1 family protein
MVDVVTLDHSCCPLVPLDVIADITHRPSFDNIEKWVRKVQAEAEPECVIALVGTKYDIAEQTRSRREVTTDEGRAAAAALGNALFCETSSLLGNGVDDVFNHLLERCTQLLLSRKNSSATVAPQAATPLLTKSTDAESGGCCGCFGR